MSAIPPLKFSTKISYGLGQATEGIKNGAFNVFIFFYYAQVLDLSTTYTGLAVFLALVLDAVTDPLIGSISDNWKSRYGRRHPFLYAAVLPLGLSLIALFSPPDLPEFGLFLWLTVFAMLTRASITLFYVPHVALGAELSADFDERTTIVAYRFFFSYIGHLVTYAIGFTLFFADSPEYPHGQFNVEAYLPFGITLAVLIGLVALYSAAGTQNRIPYLVQPAVQRPYLGIWHTLQQTLAELLQALKNVSFRWLFTGVLVVFMMVGVDQALNLHMNTYFWELQSSGNLLFFMATPIGALLGTFCSRRLTEWLDKKPLILFGTLWWAGCQVVPVVLRLFDWFPENGSDALLWTLILVKFLQGVGVVQALVAFSSMVADIVDEQELVTGKRQEGMFFAAVSFSNKVTTGLGSAVAGLALTVIAWPTGPEITTAADVAPETLIWLGLVFGPIVSGFALVSAYCYSKYNLDRKRHAEIVSELERRRAQAA
ncbi:MAG: MFS transporter [Pseudomonadaceae bacterium]|nr:MFS transporter [Pseudomonadaceae bacterium]